MSRSRARSAAAEAAKAAQNEAAAGSAAAAAGPGPEPPRQPERAGESAAEAAPVDPVAAARSDEPSDRRRFANGPSVAAPRGNGTGAGFAPERSRAAGAAASPLPDNGLQDAAPRRTLRLSHPQGGNPGPATPEGSSVDGGLAAARDRARPQQRYDRPERLGPPAGRNGGTAGRPAETHRGKGGGAIDQALRERVDGDIAAFLAAFDDALTRDSLESRAALREATDRLLRAGARTRIELERLEARVPLPPRDSGERAVAWRHC